MRPLSCIPCGQYCAGNPPSKRRAPCRCCEILTADMLPWPPPHAPPTIAISRSLQRPAPRDCHALTSSCLWCDHIAILLGSWWVCQEACPGPSHLGQGAFQKQKLLEIESLNLLSWCAATARPGQAHEVTIQMHQNSGRPAPRVPTRVAHQAGSSIWPLCSRPSAFTSTSWPPSGSTFRPDQVASRLRKQRASETRGMSRKVVRSSISTPPVLFAVRLYGQGVVRIRDIFVPSNHHARQAFESWTGSSPLARPSPACPGEPISGRNPSPKQICSTSPQKG